MKIFKLALYGDSLASPRQGVVESHERYIVKIENEIRKKGYDFIEVRDKAIGGASLPDLYNQYLQDNTYYTLPGNLFILHCGIVDCAPRPISDRTRDKISKLPEFIKKPVIKYLHNNRRKLILKGKGFVKTEKERFKNTLISLLEHAAGNYKKVAVINICPTTEEFNFRSPGLTDSIRLYNSIIKAVIEQLSKKNIELINIHDKVLDSKLKLEDFIVKADGHHIHPVTHNLIAEEILKNA